MNGAATDNARPSTPWLWLREPLLHFLVLGGVLFAVYAALNPQVDEPLKAGRIELTGDELRQMAQVWAAKWQRPPTAEEMRSLVEKEVREEMLYREALALGLDQGDTIVRRRLAQKMEFLAEDTSVIRDPAPGELEAWFEQNHERFALPGRISFRHLYFSPDRHGQRARDVAEQALEQLAGEPMNSPVAANLGDRFMYQDHYGDRVPEQIASVFGQQFAQALFELRPGAWQGPLASGLGWHLVFVDSIAPGRVPYFEEIEPQVRVEWIDVQRAGEKRRTLEAMRARYEIVLPAPDAGDTPVSGTEPDRESR